MAEIEYIRFRLLADPPPKGEGLRSDVGFLTLPGPMHYVSLIVEFLRGRPAVVFWTAALAQAALWIFLPALFYSAPPGDVPDVLAVGHEFRLGSYLGPPLAFWLAELAFKLAGAFGVYLLAQICVVVAFWAVFTLGRCIVGTRHAVLAILLMAGISAFSVPSPDFGPGVLAMPLWALALLHYWRAAGQGQRGYWFILAIELGLLLLASYLGLILLLLLVLFSAVSPRPRAAFKFAEPWIAILLALFVLAPHLVWLRYFNGIAAIMLGETPGSAATASAAARLGASFVLAHLGLGLLVALASGWPRKRRERAPTIERNPADQFGRNYIYFFALMPAATAILAALLPATIMPLDRVAPLAVLSGLAIVVAAGDQVRIYRERFVSFAWLGLLTLPPILVVLAIAVLPWTFAADLRIAQPANEMGRFFAENFQRRTGQPLAFVAGDARVASLVALGAPSRPSQFIDGAPERSPWTSFDDVRDKGAILVWPTTDTAGTPPAAIKARFPELVPEVPRVFERRVQGMLPLIRVGWAMIRPRVGAQAR